MGVNIIWLALHYFLEARDALIEFTLVFEHEAKIVSRLKIARIEFKCLAMASFSLFQTAEVAQCVAEIGMATRIIVSERDGAVIARDSGVKGAGGAKRHAHIVIGLRLIGIECERFGITPDGFFEVPSAMGLKSLFE